MTATQTQQPPPNKPPSTFLAFAMDEGGKIKEIGDKIAELTPEERKMLFEFLQESI